MRSLIEMLVALALLAALVTLIFWLSDRMPHAHSHGDLEYALSQVK